MRILLCQDIPALVQLLVALYMIHYLDFAYYKYSQIFICCDTKPVVTQNQWHNVVTQNQHVDDAVRASVS